MAKYVHGMEKVQANISKEINAVRGRTYKGMVAAMKFLENEMDTVNPVVPVSDLKKEHMRDTFEIWGNPHPTNPIVHAGYTAEYAPIVHEMVGPVNWSRTGSGPKWLQIHWDRNQFEMKMIVAQNARIKR